MTGALRRSVCGIEELPVFDAEGVTHVLSLLDPDLPELEAFARYPQHHRTILRFHDIIGPRPGWVMPEIRDVEAILHFGERAGFQVTESEHHLLVHCHMGISRSTAAMLTLMVQAHPERAEDELFADLRAMRPQAWPNSRMIGFADDLLGLQGRLLAALRRHYAIQLRAKPEFQRWMAEIGRQVELDMADPSGLPG